jgi:chaperonin GroES
MQGLRQPDRIALASAINQSGPRPARLRPDGGDPVAEPRRPGRLGPEDGREVVEEFKIDEDSRKAEGWDERNEGRDEAWPCWSRRRSPTPGRRPRTSSIPLMATAAIQFNARAYPALIDGPASSRARCWASPPGEAGTRRSHRPHMSYQLLEEMDGWEEDTDRLLMILPIVGTRSARLLRPGARATTARRSCSADKFVVNYWTRRPGHLPAGDPRPDLLPARDQEKHPLGLWLEHDLRPAAGRGQRRRGAAHLPRAAPLGPGRRRLSRALHRHGPQGDQKVVRIVARFDETRDHAYAASNLSGAKVVRIKPTRCFTKYGFIPAPDGSFYDIGFGTLLGPLSETINSTINQLMDAGHLANTVQGGFIGEGVRSSPATRFRRASGRRRRSPAGTLKDNIVPLPVKEPSRSCST